MLYLKAGSYLRFSFACTFQEHVKINMETYLWLWKPLLVAIDSILENATQTLRLNKRHWVMSTSVRNITWRVFIISSKLLVSVPTGAAQELLEAKATKRTQKRRNAISVVEFTLTERWSTQLLYNTVTIWLHCTKLSSESMRSSHLFSARLLSNDSCDFEDKINMKTYNNNKIIFTRTFPDQYKIDNRIFPNGMTCSHSIPPRPTQRPKNEFYRIRSM